MQFTLLLFSTLALISNAKPSPEKMLAFIKQFNFDFSFPRVQEIAKSINYTGWADDIVGRVDVTNTFIGPELNTEYIFGLFASFGSANTTQLIGYPLNQTISQLVIQGDTMSVSIIVNFNWTTQIVPVQFNIMYMFNDEGKVTQYDAQLVRSSWLFSTVLPSLVPLIAKELNEPIPTNQTGVFQLVTKKAAVDICQTHEKFCTGDLQQYNSTQDCMRFIQQDIPFGDIWQAGQNTGICRYLHKAMLPFRPTVHCPHVGPTGGGFCTDKDYSSTVLDDPFPKKFIQVPGHRGHSVP